MRAITRWPVHHRRWLRIISRVRQGAADRGMTTAEYAIGTVAAASFAALLIKLLGSDAVRALLMDLIESALTLTS